MKHYKQISYAFATSKQAEELGYGKTGCFYVEETYFNIEGSGQSNRFVSNNSEGFTDKHDPDLVQLLHETGGDLHPEALKWANQDIDQAWRIGKTKEQMIKDQLIEKAGINKSWADNHIEIIMG